MFLMVEVIILKKTIMREPAFDFIRWSDLVNIGTAGNDVIVRERSHRIVEGESWKRQIFFFQTYKAIKALC